jgi:hypothetical protein
VANHQVFRLLLQRHNGGAAHSGCAISRASAASVRGPGRSR